MSNKDKKKQEVQHYAHVKAMCAVIVMSMKEDK